MYFTKSIVLILGLGYTQDLLISSIVNEFAKRLSAHFATVMCPVYFGINNTHFAAGLVLVPINI